MIITEPNKFVAEVHDRMPVLRRPDQFDAWRDGSAGEEMLVPAAEQGAGVAAGECGARGE